MIIALEGLDGSGKSTIIEMLSRKLREEGILVFVTSEPTNGPIGQIIKEYLMKERVRNVKMEALLFAADRLWHLNNIMEPALRSGKIVITDRYKYSSIAYQTTSKEEEDWVREINRYVPDADLAFFIDVPPDVCIRRLIKVRRKRSIMESLENLRKVYERYLEMVKKGELIKIEGSKTIEEIVEEIVKKVKEKHEIR